MKEFCDNYNIFFIYVYTSTQVTEQCLRAETFLISADLTIRKFEPMPSSNP